MEELLNIKTNSSLIINELLNQNLKLRLELATLLSIKNQIDNIEIQMKKSQEFSPEALEILSKLDIK